MPFCPFGVVVSISFYLSFLRWCGPWGTFSPFTSVCQQTRQSRQPSPNGDRESNCIHTQKVSRRLESYQSINQSIKYNYCYVIKGNTAFGHQVAFPHLDQLSQSHKLPLSRGCPQMPLLFIYFHTACLSTTPHESRMSMPHVHHCKPMIPISWLGIWLSEFKFQM